MVSDVQCICEEDACSTCHPPHKRMSDRRRQDWLPLLLCPVCTSKISIPLYFFHRMLTEWCRLCQLFPSSLLLKPGSRRITVERAAIRAAGRLLSLLSSDPVGILKDLAAISSSNSHSLHVLETLRALASRLNWALAAPHLSVEHVAGRGNHDARIDVTQPKCSQYTSELDDPDLLQLSLMENRFMLIHWVSSIYCSR